MSLIEELLHQLEAAVAAGDRTRALTLAKQIQDSRTLAAEKDRATEWRLKELLAKLYETDESPRLGPVFESHRPVVERAGTSSIPRDGVKFPVWFGTNRQPTADKTGFTGERGSKVIFGRVEVFVPDSHRFGETGSNFWKRLISWTDDRLHLLSVTAIEHQAWLDEIRGINASAKAGEGQSHAVVFLHGFNVSFEEAAIRAAQIGCDLKVPGATAFFSWPSRGSVMAYSADEATIEASERAITDFLVDFATQCGAERVHVIAHSMGNRGLLRALQRIAADAETLGKVKFGQILLAAPDVDRDLFLDLARLYPEHSERTTLYASDGDLPVQLSAKLHDAPRAGYFKPYTVAPGVDTIAVPDFDVDLLGHSYFAQAEALLHDIYDLIRRGEAPDKRQRIAPTTHESASFWKLLR